MNFFIVMAATWLINGSIKFIFNFIKDGKKAFSLIGYGGLPSTHTAIVVSMFCYTGFSHGWNDPAIAALLVILWVVVSDAKSLRSAVGRHAAHLNTIDPSRNHRERIGHTPIEIICGAAVGGIIGTVFSKLLLLNF